MRIRRTALTFATCHQARSETSALARATTSRRIRLRRAGMLIRIAATASSGPMRRAALGLDGDAALAGGRRVDLLVVRHGAYRTPGADDAPDVACALPAAQVLVAQAARPGGGADRRGDGAGRPRARPVLRVRRRADRGGGAGPPRGRRRRQPVRDLPGARRPRRRATRTRSRRRGARGAGDGARGGGRAGTCTPLPALRRRGGTRRRRRGGEPRSWPCTCAARAAAARAARSRCGPTCGWPARRTRPATATRRGPPVFARLADPQAGARRRCATSASCSPRATCARSRRSAAAILAEPDGAMRDCLLLALTGALAQGSRMMADHGRDGGGASWKLNIYWLPERSLELDPFRCFANRLQRVVAAKRETAQSAGRARRAAAVRLRRRARRSRRTCRRRAPPTCSPTRPTAARASSTPSCPRCGAPGWTRRSSPATTPRSARTRTGARPRRLRDRTRWTASAPCTGRSCRAARMTVTFASRDPRSWRALDAALAGAGFRVDEQVEMGRVGAGADGADVAAGRRAPTRGWSACGSSGRPGPGQRTRSLATAVFETLPARSRERSSSR